MSASLLGSAVGIARNQRAPEPHCDSDNPVMLPLLANRTLGSIATSSEFALVNQTVPQTELVLVNRVRDVSGGECDSALQNEAPSASDRFIDLLARRAKALKCSMQLVSRRFKRGPIDVNAVREAGFIAPLEGRPRDLLGHWIKTSAAPENDKTFALVREALIIEYEKRAANHARRTPVNYDEAAARVSTRLRKRARGDR